MYALHDYAGGASAGRAARRRLRRALEASVRPGSVVVDIGTGTGSLFVVACRLGARRVYAIDTNPSSRSPASRRRKNRCADRIELIQDDALRVMLREQADVVVSGSPWPHASGSGSPRGHAARARDVPCAGGTLILEKPPPGRRRELAQALRAAALGPAEAAHTTMRATRGLAWRTRRTGSGRAPSSLAIWRLLRRDLGGARLRSRSTGSRCAAKWNGPWTARPWATARALVRDDARRWRRVLDGTGTRWRVPAALSALARSDDASTGRSRGDRPLRASRGRAVGWNTTLTDSHGAVRATFKQSSFLGAVVKPRPRRSSQDGVHRERRHAMTLWIHEMRDQDRVTYRLGRQGQSSWRSGPPSVASCAAPTDRARGLFRRSRRRPRRLRCCKRRPRSSSASCAAGSRCTPPRSARGPRRSRAGRERLGQVHGGRHALHAPRREASRGRRHAARRAR